VCDGDGRLRALDFHDHEARMQRLLRRHYGEGRYRLTSGRAPVAVSAAIDAFFAGELAAIDVIAVRTGGTAFQRRVWEALRRIPAGSATTYGGLATAIGRPKACRALGLANGSNPLAIVVPCHRVIGADGTLRGYGGGIERKRWLLAHERRCSSARSVVEHPGRGTVSDDTVAGGGAALT
jgi:methylated-DNA-[protein]-cysteine S-methyltransferase